MMDFSRVFLWVAITLLLGLFLPFLVQDGMFLDGVTYAAISKNMAEGLGTFWEPHYTQTNNPIFFGHPPLVMIIQSFFFRFFGGGFWTERIFCGVVIVASIWGLYKLWIIALPNRGKTFFIPLLAWLSIPLVSWAYKNNMLENTMGLFCLGAVYYGYKAMKEDRVLCLALSAPMILAAFFCKGFVGLFPLAVPVCYALVYGEYKKGFLQGVSLGLMTLGGFAVLWYGFPAIQHNLTNYWAIQMRPALTDTGEITTDFRARIFLDLLLDMSIPLLFVVVLGYKAWKRGQFNTYIQNRSFMFFLLVALSASLPLMLTLKQRRFYLMPSILFYALALGALVEQPLSDLLEQIRVSVLQRVKCLTIFCLVGVGGFSLYYAGGYSRDEARLKDIYTLTKHCPKGTLLSSSLELNADWALVAYLSRIASISLDVKEGQEYLLLKQGEDVARTYRPIDIDLEVYTLYKKIDDGT